MAKLIKILTFGENFDEKLVKLPYLVLFISLILSLGVTFLFYRSTKNKDSIRFSNSIAQIQTTLENKINLYVALLKSSRAFIESTETLNRKRFKTYVAGLELEKNYVGLVGIGYTKVVLPNERETLTAQMKAEGFTDFRIFPESSQSLNQAIIYIEPQNDLNRRVIGFDMSTEENRRQALIRARDYATESATGKVVLKQETEENGQPGFLIYLPIYKDGKFPATVQERRQNLIGYVYCTFRAKDFLTSSIGENAFPDIELKIYDIEIKEENLLASSETAQNRNLADERENKGFYEKNNIEVAGRRWIVEYTPTSKFFVQSNQGLSPIIFVIGAAFSFLLFGMTYAQAASRHKLQKIAIDLLEVEQEKQNLLEKEQRARLIAEQANKTKDEFISSVSHELRTPLNAIAGWAKILKSDNLSVGTKELALQKIERNLRSQTKIVEELLDFSQIISNKVNFETESFAFYDIFENVVIEIEPGIKEKEIELLKTNDLNGQIIVGDRRKIKIAIENLLANAIKFTPPCGKIEVRASVEEEKICFVVKDNGSGIKQEFLPHIFDHFRQEDASSTKFYGGLGLGLAISHHIIKLHHGTIEAVSEGHQKGSTFIVKIPYKKD